MAELVDSLQATQVQRFAGKMAVTSPPSEPECQDLAQLRADFLDDQERKSAQTYAEIEEIEDRLVGNTPDDEGALAKARQDLLHAMDEFRKQAPGSSLPVHYRWDWKDVDSAISTVEDQWKLDRSESHVSRAVSCLRKMCHGLHKHSAVLKMVPSENNYVSIISGAVSMIIKAAATHIEVTEAFATGVTEINDAVAGIQTQIYDSDILKLLVMRLYSHVFAYLGKFMKWHTGSRRTRFFKSFNENLKPELQDDIRKVKDTCTTLARQIQNHMSADVKVTKMLVKHQNANIEYLVGLHEEASRDTKLRDAAKMDMLQNQVEMLQNQIHDMHQKSSEETRISMEQMMQQYLGYHERLRKEISGAAMSSLLLQQAQNHDENSHLSSEAPRMTYELELAEEASGPSRAKRQDDRHRWIDVKLSTAHFEGFYDKEKIYPFPDHPQTIMSDRLVVSRLESFTTSMSSQMLYLFDEPRPSDHPHFLQHAVGAYILLAREQRIPVVSYFCALSHEKPPPNRTRESVELCAAMYSMLGQLINLLPSDFVARKAMFTAEALKTLDGKLTTWDLALDLIEGLVECLKMPLLLFVVDGLDLLEDGPRSPIYAKAMSLVHRLRSVVEAQGSDRIVKVLFSTASLSHVLSAQMEDTDTMCCREIFTGQSPRARFKLRHSH